MCECECEWLPFHMCPFFMQEVSGAQINISKGSPRSVDRVVTIKVGQG